MDAVIGVERDRARDVRRWSIRKMKDAEDDAEAAFDLTGVEVETDDMGIPVTSCAVVPAPGAPLPASAGIPSGKNQQAVLTALLADDRGARGWRETELSEVAKAALHYIGSKHRATRARDAITALVDAGHLTLDEGVYHLPP